MGTITLSSEDSGSNSILSNTFIDYYMPEANGDFVKVYLYLLRLQQGSHTACSISKIADHLQCTDNDVERAIKYWIGKDLLQYSLDDAGRPVGLILCQPQQPASAQPTRIVDFQLIRQDMRPDSASDSSATADAPAYFSLLTQDGTSLLRFRAIMVYTMFRIEAAAMSRFDKTVKYLRFLKPPAEIVPLSPHWKIILAQA